MKILDLIQEQEKVLGQKLIEAMKTQAGINKIIRIIADQQAESMAIAYRAGLQEKENINLVAPGFTKTPLDKNVK